MNRFFLLASLAATACLAGCAASPDGMAPADDQAALRHAPSDPGAPPSTSSQTRTFVVRSFDLGASDPDGVPDPNAWTRIGLDIDGLATTRDSKNVCRLAPGAFPTVHQDGVDGIDNSFGANIVPMLVTLLGQDVNARMNATLSPKDRTDLLAIRGADATGDATVSAMLNGTAMTRAWIANGTFVTAPSTRRFQLALGEADDGTGTPSELVLPVEHLQIVAPLADGAWSIESGVISGIIPAEEAVHEVQDFVLTMHPDESPDMLATFEQMVRQAADILVDGTQDETRPCDGISVGVRFAADARPAQLSPRVPLPRPSDVPSAAAR